MEPHHFPPHIPPPQYPPGPPVGSFPPPEHYQFPPPVYPPHFPANPPPARGYHHHHRPRPYHTGRGGRGQRGGWKRRRDWSDGQSHSDESLYNQSMFEDPWQQLMSEEEAQKHQEQLAANIKERLPPSPQDEEQPAPMAAGDSTVTPLAPDTEPETRPELHDVPP